MNGLASANVSNRPALLGLENKEELPQLSDGLIFSFDVGLCAGAAASDLTLARGCIKFSGMSVVCTGVMPPKEALPPQNALDGDAARRGDDGRSFWVFGVTSEELGPARTAGASAGIGPGGGSTGDSARSAEARRAFLRALISCLNAAFSD